MFNLENYEDVNTRITRFRQEFPMGRLEAYIEDFDAVNGRILIKALVFRTDEPGELPAAIDYAYESQKTSGVNRDFWVENAVTSAYGRVIGALTPSTARPTRQDMEKAQRLNAPDPKIPTAAESIAMVKAKLGGRMESEAPKCEHGHRLRKEGTSPKTGKPYLGFICPERSKAKQCQPIWFRQTPDGKDWLSPEDKADHDQDHFSDASYEPTAKEPPPFELMSDAERERL